LPLGTGTSLTSTPLTLEGPDSTAEFSITVTDSQGNQGSRFYSVLVFAQAYDPGAGGGGGP
jgi:hypothetical protein